MSELAASQWRTRFNGVVQRLEEVVARNRTLEAELAAEERDHERALTLMEAALDDLIRAFFDQDHDCAHNMTDAYRLVERIVAERVRVVEGERDREAEYVRYLQAELDADAKHAALKPGEQCDVCTHLESEQVQEWMNSDLDYRARAESAEAAHEALRKGIEALADEWEQETRTCDGMTPSAFAPDLRALLAGGAS